MATKKIVPSVTLHVAAKGHKPYEFDAFSNRIGGDYKVVEVRPGQVVEIEADEADELIARGKAEVYVDPTSVAAAGDVGKQAVK